MQILLFILFILFPEERRELYALSAFSSYPILAKIDKDLKNPAILRILEEERAEVTNSNSEISNSNVNIGNIHVGNFCIYQETAMCLDLSDLSLSFVIHRNVLCCQRLDNRVKANPRHCESEQRRTSRGVVS